MLTRSLRQIRRRFADRMEQLPVLGRSLQHERNQQVFRSWIEGLPVTKPQLCAEWMLASLPRLIALELPIEVRFDLLERLSEQLASVLAALESGPDGLSDPVSGLLAERLLIRLSEAYASHVFAHNISLRSASITHDTRLAALRCGQYCYRRTLLACRLRRSLGIEHWNLMTRLYRHARDAHFHDLALDEQTADTVTRFFTRILLLVLVDPQTLTLEQIEQARFYLERYGQMARITTPKEWTGDDEGWFLAWPAEGGLRPMMFSQHIHPEIVDRLLLDTHPLLARLDSQREELAHGNSPTRLGLPRHARDESYQLLLDTLRQRWSAPQLRRTQRYPLRPQATVFVGFEDIREAVQQGLSGDGDGGLPGEDWEIADRSATGFRIEQARARATRIGVGDLVGLCAHEDSRLNLTVARRARSNSDREQEFGLELLGGSCLAVRYTPAADEDNTSPAPIPLIFLPHVPRLDNAPALLAPLNEVEAGIELNLPLHGKSVRFATADRIERFAHCELIRLNPQATPS